ncbi:MAG: pilus assembly protein PilE [Azoarcus sp.]|nr:pilus assembly protein PilE [Azoarcus sp.]
MAVPNYRSSMLKTRRATATACLLELSQFMERIYTVELDYSKAAFPAGASSLQCQRNLAEYYNFALDGEAEKRKYAIQATPQGSQTADTCGTLSIDQAGAKTPDNGSCWR